MKRVISAVGVMLLSVWLGGVVRADVVVFKNGDRLTGTLVSMQGGAFKFKAAMVGEVSIKAAQIETFSSEEPAEVHLQDGTVIHGPVRQGQTGTILVEAVNAATTGPLTIGEVKAINPPAKEKPRWKGTVSAGYTAVRGNTWDSNGNLGFEAQLRRERDRISTSGTYFVGRNKDDQRGEYTNEETLILGGRYDYFFSKKWYSFFNGRYKKDHIADLDYQVMAGGGMGDQWIESEKMNFSTDVGLADVSEQYTANHPSPIPDVVTRSNKVSAQAGYHYDWAINKTFSLVHNLRYYPAFEDVSDYLVTADMELRMSISKSLYASFRALLDYDSTPGKDSTSTDTKYIVGLGLSL